MEKLLGREIVVELFAHGPGETVVPILLFGA